MCCARDYFYPRNVRKKVLFLYFLLLKYRSCTSDRMGGSLRSYWVCVFAICVFEKKTVFLFQETNVEIVHLTGAMLVFGVGVIYAIIQTSLTYHMEPDFNGLYICRVRMALTILSAMVMVISILYYLYRNVILILFLNNCD